METQPKGCGNCGHRCLPSWEPPASRPSPFCFVGRHMGDWPSGAPACTSWRPAEDADHDRRNDEAAAKWQAQVDAGAPPFKTDAKTGPRCPMCGKNDVAEGGPVEIEGDMAVQEIHCQCGALYHEWYTYSNAVLLERSPA